MKGARLTRSSVSSRGSIERSSEEVTSGQFPETQIGEIRQCGTHKPLCLPIQRTQGRRFYDPKYRETSPVAIVLDTPQQLTTVNWRSSIFELTPFESKGFLSWGEGLRRLPRHGGTGGKRFVSASGRHVDPVNLHFLEMENVGCGKKKERKKERGERPIDSVIPRWNLDGRSKRWIVYMDPLGDRLNDEKGDSKVSLIIKPVWVYARV